MAYHLNFRKTVTTKICHQWLPMDPPPPMLQKKRQPENMPPVINYGSPPMLQKRGNHPKSCRKVAIRRYSIRNLGFIPSISEWYKSEDIKSLITCKFSTGNLKSGVPLFYHVPIIIIIIFIWVWFKWLFHDNKMYEIYYSASFHSPIGE